MVEVEHRQIGGLRTRGDDDLVRVHRDGLAAAGARRPRDPPPGASRPVPRITFTPAFLRSTSTFSRIWVTTRSLRAIMRGKSGRPRRDLEPVLLARARPGQGLGAGQQGLGGDTAPVETGAADEVLLDQGDGRSVTGRPQGGHVAARAGTQDGYPRMVPFHVCAPAVSVSSIDKHLRRRGRSCLAGSGYDGSRPPWSGRRDTSPTGRPRGDADSPTVRPHPASGEPSSPSRWASHADPDRDP